MFPHPNFTAHNLITHDSYNPTASEFYCTAGLALLETTEKYSFKHKTLIPASTV